MPTILEIQPGPTPKPSHKRRCPLLPRGLPLLALLCLTAAVLSAACGDAAEPTTTSSSTTSLPASTTAAPSAIAAPSTTTTSIPPTTTLQPPTELEDPDGVGGFDVDRDADWQYVFDTLTPSEQSCIRDAVGAELEGVLRQAILDEDEMSQQELALLPCLPPQLVRAVFLAGMVLGMEDDGVAVDEEQEACLREVVDEMDVAALVSVIASESGASDDAAQAENAARLLEMMAGLLRCLPELFDAATDEPDDFADGVEGAARVVLGEAVEGVLDYEGDVDYFVFEAVEGELYEIDVDLGTLPDSLVAIADADGLQLDYNDDRGGGSLGSRLVWRAPVSGDFYVEVSGYGEGSYTLTVGLLDIVDDFADGVEGAARVVLGETVEGGLDYPGDVDYFVFEAVEGELYEIDVDLGTLPDSVVAIADADGLLLGYNDDRGGGSLGSRLVWTTAESGDFYVEVSGYGEGSYSLTLGASDIVDDFADGVEGAARVVLGETVEGGLDYPGDVDYFVFEAVEGELYEIDVDLGTLPDSLVAIADADGLLLSYNDDRGGGSLASRIVWRAPASRDFYVEVSGYGEGSYTLTVGLLDIVDDFADGVEGAARVVLGEAVEGVLDYEGDVDYFVFEAVEGELYEIDVDLGTLPDSLVAIADADGLLLSYNDDRGGGSLGSRLVWRAPVSGDFYVEVSGYGEGSYSLIVGVSDIVDDFADGVEGAARVVLDNPVEGVLDYGGDVDYFVFEAVEGELYEIDVDLGTLPDSVVAIADADGLLLSYNDDRGGGSLGSRLVWRAPASRDFYVEVSGYGEGSYTLTVGLLDIVDDFADGVEGAARVVLGEAVEGALDYEGDVDYFVFEAVEGELYELEVDLGTLSDSVVAVFDAYEWELDRNDDREDGSLASRLLWRPPATGDFYVEVSGFGGEGSYVLTVAVSE